MSVNINNNIEYGNLFESTFKKHLNILKEDQSDSELQNVFSKAIVASKKIPVVNNTTDLNQIPQTEEFGANSIIEIISFILSVPVFIKYLGFLAKTIKTGYDKIVNNKKTPEEQQLFYEKFLHASEKAVEYIEKGIQFTLEKLGVFKRVGIKDEKIKKQVSQIVYLLIVFACMVNTVVEFGKVVEMIKSKHIFTSLGTTLKNSIDIFESGKEIQAKILAIVNN
jgi:hypothetical protein